MTDTPVSDGVELLPMSLKVYSKVGCPPISDRQTKTENYKVMLHFACGWMIFRAAGVLGRLFVSTVSRHLCRRRLLIPFLASTRVRNMRTVMPV